jgi:hypothetical protein
MVADIWRFHLFGGSNYYPIGGMDDYCGSFHSPEDAADYIRSSERLDWWELATVNERGALVKTHIWEFVGQGGWALLTVQGS